MSATDDLAQLIVKIKDLIKRESAKALADIDAYNTMAMSHPYAAHEDVEQAVDASRKVQDAVSEIKSGAMIAADNAVKESQNNS
ncbi:hypothetical protein HY250_00430 [Candidatus Azambacteria bacterium]|nr:hypothetical protein [Candidatus Azambacteria bacterium]MBI3684865.1 hypothetical protein [Candidatus Azambacteria bacterium]